MSRFIRFAFALLLAVASVAAIAQVQDDDSLAENKLRVELMPYLIVPGMHGDTVVRGNQQSLNVSAGDIFSHLQFGAMGRTRLSYNRWFVGTDTVYMGLGGANNVVDVGFDQWAAELLGGFRVHKRFTVLGGARYNSLSTNMKFKGPASLNPRGSQVWWDPFFGGEGKLPLTSKLNFTARLDVGGFGAGSRIAVNSEPLLNYHFNQRYMASVGWKFLYQNYRNEGQAFEYDVLTQGPVIGMTIRW